MLGAQPRMNRAASRLPVGRQLPSQQIKLYKGAALLFNQDLHLHLLQNYFK